MNKKVFILKVCKAAGETASACFTSSPLLPPPLFPSPWRWYVVFPGWERACGMSDNIHNTLPCCVKPERLDMDMKVNFSAACYSSSAFHASLLWYAQHSRPELRWLRALIWVEAPCGVMFTCLWPTFAECWLISHAGVLCLCVCVTGRRTTTTSTQSATAQDLGGGWPSRRALGPALDYQSQCAALSAVSICVYLSSLSVAWNFHH